MSNVAERIALFQAGNGFELYLKGLGLIINPDDVEPTMQRLDVSNYANRYYDTISDPGLRLAANGLRMVIDASMSLYRIRYYQNAEDRYGRLEGFYKDVGARVYDERPPKDIFEQYPQIPDNRYNPLLSQLVFIRLLNRPERLTTKHMFLGRQPITQPLLQKAD